jgi:Tfp pilus assembly protein PilF
MWIVAAFCAIGSQHAVAQPYPGITPVPRTTDPARMHALANDREVVERIRTAVDAENRHDYAVALRELGRAIALHPAEPQGSTAEYDLGIAQAGTGDMAAAADSFRAALALDPGFLAARANLVAAALEGGDLKAARATADEFVRAAPDSARALYSRGIVALRAGDSATALVDFRKLLASDPSYAVAHYDLAIAEEQRQDYGESERELRAALALAPAYTRARLALGAVLLREGRRVEARLAFDDALRETSDSSLRNLAVSLRDAIDAKGP